MMPILRLHNFLFIFFILSSSTITTCCNGFAFQLPQIKLPWDASSSTTSSSTNSNKKSGPILPNDKIVIFGGTGGVGQLVTRKLLARTNKSYKVTVVARNVESAKEVLTSPNDDDGELNLNVVQLNLVGENKATPDELKVAMDGASGIVISVGTTAFPTKKWNNGNNPRAIDDEAVARIASVAADIPTLRRIVLLTSVGVDRTNEMPFVILNLFGVLDAKRAGEDAIKQSAQQSNNNFSYSIIRPGRLVGGPYTNLDLAKLFQVEGGATNGVTLEKGDTLLGDCKRDVAAEAVLQCLENVECNDVEFSMVSNDERALTDGEWSEAFVEMRT